MSSQRTIAELAYQLWLARGSPMGSSDLDWLEAERQVTGKTNAPPDASSIDGNPRVDHSVR